MLRHCRLLPIAVALLVPAATASAREACQERTLSLRYSPQEGRHWCWAASGQMVMEWLGEKPQHACQCRQAEQVLGVTGCCASSTSCTRAADAPAACDEPRWPGFVDRPERYRFHYETTCDDLPGRQDDVACDLRPLGWRELTAEICAGRPVLAALRAAGSTQGHVVVVKGFSTRPHRRVLVVDPIQLCPPGRDCEGELDEAFWLSYDEFAAGWGGRRHWVDFHGIRAGSEKRSARPTKKHLEPKGREVARSARRAREDKDAGPRRAFVSRGQGDGYAR